MKNTKKISKASFAKRILYFFRPFWKYFIGVGLILIAAQLMGAFSPLLFGKSVDAVTHRDISATFYFLAIAFFLTFLQSVVLGLVRERIEILYLDDYVDKHFSEISLKKMLSFSVGQHHNEHSGVKQSVAGKGQNALSGFMNTILYQVLPSMLQILVTIVVLACFDWKTALVATVFSIAYCVMAFRGNVSIFPGLEKMRTKKQGQQKIQSELYRNATLVIAEGQQSKTLHDFSGEYQKVAEFVEAFWLNWQFGAYTKITFLIVGRYATLAVGVYLIIAGHHAVGMFVTLFSWVTTIFGNLQQIAWGQRQTLFQLTEIKKYFALLDIAPDIEHDKKGITLSELRGAIAFEGVSFAYPYRTSKEEADKIDEGAIVAGDSEKDEKKEDHVVTDINFAIPAGAKIGFVGMSGSGKSTIINLIRRYYDATQGTISIDGVPIKDLDLQWLRSQIGNVDQKIDLFDKSVRENILFGIPAGQEVDEDALQHVVAQASLGDFVAKLKEHGLDTVIGEGGIKVSGGERQRIGIARALIKNPKILIFDEATSALDSINEKLIHDAINASAKGRTTIIIAHRLSTVMDADAIYVVADGKIVDHGTHAELEKRCEEYQALIKNQILL